MFIHRVESGCLNNSITLVSRFGLCGLLTATLLAAGGAKAGTVWLDELDLSSVTQGWGEVHKNRSVDDHDLTIGGVKFDRGMGTHAESAYYLNLDGGTK